MDSDNFDPTKYVRFPTQGHPYYISVFVPKGDLGDFIEYIVKPSENYKLRETRTPSEEDRRNAHEIWKACRKLK